MASLAGSEAELTGLLAAERAVMLAVSDRQRELAAVDCSGFTREEFADHTCEVVATAQLGTVATARFAALAQEQACSLTKGESSMTGALNRACRIGRAQGARLDLVGSAPDRYPRFYDAVMDGSITAAHIQVVHPVWKRIDTVQFAAAERHLCDLAAACTPEEFAHFLAQWENHADENGLLDRFIEQQGKQHLTYGFDVFGSVHYSGTVGPEHAEPFIETIQTEAKNHRTDNTSRSQALGGAIVDLVLHPDGKQRVHLEILSPEHHRDEPQPKTSLEAEDEPDPDESLEAGRARRQARYEAHLAQQDAARAAAAGRALVRALRIPDPNDTGFSSIHHARTARGTLIPAAIVQQLKTNGARVTVHKVDADGTIAGDRPGGRHFSAGQKRLIRLRDNACRHPGCRRPARNCEYDHTKPFDHGGPTLICNGQLLCKLHHRWKHRHDAGPERPTIFDDGPLVIQLE